MTHDKLKTFLVFLDANSVFGHKQRQAVLRKLLGQPVKAFGINFPGKKISFSNCAVGLQGADVTKNSRGPESFIVNEIPRVIIQADEIKRLCFGQADMEKAR